MQTRKEFIIQFVGLSQNEHEFEFNVNDKFFEDHDYSEIKKGNVLVNLTLLKQSQMMTLIFKIGGTVKMNCDRCTEEFDLPISGTFKLIVKVGGHDSGDEDDDIITLPANEHQIDISQYLYEYITLSLPFKRVHPNDKNGKPTCDKKMLKKLEKFLIEQEKTEATDPRWNDLKKIKLN